MTQFASQAPDIVRAASVVPDIANIPSSFGGGDGGGAFSDPVGGDALSEFGVPTLDDLVPPTPISPSRDARDASAKLDMSVYEQRASTPKAAVDQRSASRYSISEANTFTPDQIAEMLAHLDPQGERSTWLKALDIIDLPRNLVANFVTENFLPEAKRMALERKEFDQFGNAKVFGSDILRAMGFSNDFVAGVGGFAIDIFTDPLTFVGGPIGATKSVATKSAGRLASQAGKATGERIAGRATGVIPVQSEITSQGTRQLRGAIKAAGNGDRVGSKQTRDLIDETLRFGMESGELAEDAGARRVREYLTNKIIGERSGFTQAAGRIGFGETGRGGTLARDLAVSLDEVDLRFPELAQRRAAATRAFVAKHTTNPGIDLTRGAGGIELAHIPFTNQTLTVPGFRSIPGRLDSTGITPGRATTVEAELSRVIEGKPVERETISRAFSEKSQIEDLSNRATDAYDRMIEADRTAVDLSQRDMSIVEELNEIQREVNNWRERALTRAEPSAKEVSEIEDIGDLVATARAQQAAMAEARAAEASLSQIDASMELQRATRADVAEARRVRESIVEEARQRLDVDALSPIDEVLDPANRSQELNRIVQRWKDGGAVRHANLIDLADKELDAVEGFIDAMHRKVDAAWEISDLYGQSVRNTAGSSNRVLAAVAARLMGTDDTTLGMMPLAPIGRILRGANVKDASATRLQLANLADRSGRAIARNFGGLGGTQEMFRTAVRRQASGSSDAAARMTDDFRKGLGEFSGVKGFDGVARDAGAATSGEKYDRLDRLVSMVAESKLRRSMGAQELAVSTAPGSAAGRVVREAIEDGFLGNPQVRQDIDALADRFVEVFRRQRDQMIARGELDPHFVNDEYLPVGLTPQAQARAQSQFNESGRAATASAADPAKPRDTNIVEFTDSKGNVRSFLLMEKKWTDEVDRLSQSLAAPESREAYDDIRSAVEEFRRIHVPTDGTATIDDIARSFSRPMLPAELNEFASSGRLDGLVGGPLADNVSMFETSAMAQLYNRTRSARVAEAEAAFADIVQPFILDSITQDRHLAAQVGSKATLRDGTVLTRIGENQYEHGGVLYRRIADLNIKEDSVFSPQKLLGDANPKDALVPEQLGVAIERMNEVLRPENLGMVMSFANETTNAFKVTTLLHPSWFVGNVLGTTLLVGMGLANPERMAKFAARMKAGTTAVVKEAMGRTANETMVANGVRTPVRELMELARENQVMSGGVAGDAQRQFLNQLGRRNAPLGAAGARGAIRSIPTRIREARSRKIEELASMRSSGKASRVDNIRAHISSVRSGAVNRAVSAWYGVNGVADDAFRFTYFVHLLDEGMDPVAAGMKVRRDLLNFGDMTAFERQSIRPLVPFYAWTRASAPNMLARVVRQPQHIAVVPKLAEALEQMMAGEDTVPKWARPSWLNETVAIQVSTDPELAFLLGTLLPQEGAVQVAGGALGAAGSLGIPSGGFDGRDLMDAFNWALGQSAPVAKVPFEVATGVESFTGRTIGPDVGEGDITLNDFLLRQIRPVRELGFGLLDEPTPINEAVGRGDLGAAAGRAIIGGRLTDAIGEEGRSSAKFFELREREAELRSGVRRAEDNGNKKRSDELRVDLMTLYANHIRGGGDPADVPRWARDELELLGVDTSPVDTGSSAP